MTLYIPTHEDGRTGPTFAFATLAAFWIAEQPDRDGWWINPQELNA